MSLVPFLPVNVPLVAAFVLSVHALYGVCGYIWTAYYDETHGTIPPLEYSLILAAVTMNMGKVVKDWSIGRVFRRIFPIPSTEALINCQSITSLIKLSVVIL